MTLLERILKYNGFESLDNLDHYLKDNEIAKIQIPPYIRKDAIISYRVQEVLSVIHDDERFKISVGAEDSFISIKSKIYSYDKNTRKIKKSRKKTQ